MMGGNEDTGRGRERKEEIEPVSVFDMPMNLAYPTPNIKYFISPEMTKD